MPADAARVESIFQSATEIPDAAARSNYLDDACAGDAVLKARILSLLQAHDHPDSLLDQPVVKSPDPELAATRAFENPDDTRAMPGQSEEIGDEPLSFLAPSSRPDSLGKIGQYDVLEVLGRGGFGIVFRAFDDKLQRVVAVKVMAPSLATTSPARKRFLREARSSAQVRHENVVQVHAVEEQPLPHLVMEFVPGETLQQRLDRTGPLDTAEILKIGRQIAEGLAAAHATGLIHRDIKPSNILVYGDANPVVKITDFGLARAADDASLTRSGVVAGTPMYMAPEQAKGEPLDHRADLFSLGSVLYVLASGRPPFRASSTLAVLKRVADETPRPIREIIPEVPEWLCRIIEKLQAKNPVERFQSCREVAAVLANCERQLFERNAIIDFTGIPGGRPTRKSKRWAMVAVAIGLFLLPLIAWAFFALNRPGPSMSSPGDFQPTAPTWGEVIDPEGDSGFDQKGDRLSVTLPGGTLRDLFVGFGASRNAPRVLQEVNGDFECQVTVHPLPRPRTEVKDKMWGASVGGGLLVWLDDTHFVCLSRSASFSGAAAISDSVCILQTRTAARSLPAPDGPVQLRVRRDRGVLYLEAKSDASGWQEVNSVRDFPATARLRVGVFASTTANEPLTCEFESFRLTETPKSGFTPLFNGKDLTGWTPAGSWKVQNGILTGTADRPSMLDTKLDDYANFHLRAEVRVIDGAAGLWFRHDPALPGKGYKALLGTVPNAFPTGSLHVSPGDGKLGYVRSAPQSLLKPDEWFTLEVLADGPTLTIKVNGTTTADLLDGVHARGRIGLEVVGTTTKVEFRKIEIKNLSPNLVATVPHVAVAPFNSKQAAESQGAWVKHLGVPVEFADEYGHSFRLIPPGEFDMGTSEKEIEKLIADSLSDKAWEWAYPRLRSESPVRKVRIESAFYMATHETTVRQFREFVKATGYKTHAEIDGGGWVYDGPNATRKPEAVWNSPKYFVSDDAPVGYLVRDDANAYCRWLSRMTGCDVSLPTEQQWEYACRAGTTTAWSHGNDPKELKRFAWTSDVVDSPVKAVGRLVPNPFGLYDMHGNIDELAMGAAGEAILRGGSVAESAVMARSARRIPVDDFLPYRATGFRIVIAGDLKKASAKKDSPAEGWSPLFNGKDIAGWKAHPKSTQKNWRVENGILTGSGDVSYLFSPAQYANFNLRAEFQVNKAGNGGIYLRSPFPAANAGPHPAGYEVQILGPEAAPSNYQTGGLVNFTDAKGTRIDADTWYTLEIIAHGPNMSVMLNGVTMSDVKDEKNAYIRGHIALQLWDAGTTVRFRKLEILQLPSDPPAGTAPDPDVVKALEAKIAAVESALANVRASHKEKRVPRAAVIGAESAVIEAKIKLAEEWKRHDEVVKLAGEAVTKQEELRGMMNEQVKAGVLPKSTLDAIDSTIADAKLRLAKAKLNRPEKKP